MKLQLLCCTWLCFVFPECMRKGHRSHFSRSSGLLLKIFLVTPRYMRMELHENVGMLTGKLNRDSLEGTLQGETIHFVARSDHNDQFDFSGSLRDGVINATMNAAVAGHSKATYTFALTARPVQPLHHKAPMRHEFHPTVFYRQFSALNAPVSALNAPVLTIAPVDAIHTTTTDAGGTDADNVRRAAGVNPQTGPFYVSGTMPCDVLVIHINKVRLNRDWALSDDGIVDRGQNRDTSLRMK